MDTEFWLERWRTGQTHFHQARVTPLLAKYWPTLALPAGCKVLVPLCGRSLDMAWLAGQGHKVLGAELSPLAVEQFFADHGLQPQVREADGGRYYAAGDIEIYCGDIFDLGADVLGQCEGAYDRAALVALPQPMRARYAQHIYGQLAGNYRGLLLTLEYDQDLMDGPPFSVGEAEAMSVFHGHTDITLIDRRDILDKEPKFAERGLQRLDTLVFRLQGSRP